jgi:hypothetical protein
LIPFQNSKTLRLRSLPSHAVAFPGQQSTVKKWQRISSGILRQPLFYWGMKQAKIALSNGQADVNTVLKTETPITQTPTVPPPPLCVTR